MESACDGMHVTALDMESACDGMHVTALEMESACDGMHVTDRPHFVRVVTSGPFSPSAWSQTRICPTIGTSATLIDAELQGGVLRRTPWQTAEGLVNRLRRM